MAVAAVTVGTEVVAGGGDVTETGAEVVEGESAATSTVGGRGQYLGLMRVRIC